MQPLDDTIVAISTPAGSSPRAIVRLSGPRAFELVESLLASAPVASASGNQQCPIRDGLQSLPPYTALDAHLRLRPNGPLIPATLYLMRAPRSYTRQHVAEVHTIGSPPLLRMLLEAFVRLGARIAEPGEFTRRAFLAGRIDLAQAEAVLAIIRAASVGQLRAAARALQGVASRRLRDLHDRLVHLRSLVEASIDFAEHDIKVIAPEDVSAAVGDAIAIIADASRSADSGALPPEGIRVLLCGPPNAGKSSLFNALLGRPRAIVTPIPGTTRDAVGEPLIIQGVHFQLFDTAGLPSSSIPLHPVDSEAVARSRGLIAGAHIALVVLDASQPLGEAERRLWRETDAPYKLLILNKSDLPPAISDQDAATLLSSGCPPSPLPHRAPSAFRISALTGAGIPGLKAALAALVRSGHVEASPSDITWNARQLEALNRARMALERARQAAAEGLGAEFIAADLREAHDALGAITGQVAPEDLLDYIFSQFCIGK